MQEELKPRLSYNREEIHQMTFEYFQYVIVSFWKETKTFVSEEEFVAMATAIAMRQVKLNNIEDISIHRVKSLIREIIHEENQKNSEAYRNNTINE